MRFIGFFLFFMYSTQAVAEGFTAVCEADETHAYRNSLDIAGNPLPKEWTDGEIFFSKWTFVFDGEDELLLDGEPIPILFWDGTSLIAVSHSENSDAGATWTYAFNLQLKDVVGSEVNSYKGLGVGIKARSTNFNCEFSIHAI